MLARVSASANAPRLTRMGEAVRRGHEQNYFPDVVELPKSGPIWPRVERGGMDARQQEKDSRRPEARVEPVYRRGADHRRKARR